MSHTSATPTIKELPHVALGLAEVVALELAEAIHLGLVLTLPSHNRHTVRSL